jgi:hypothetical protein
LYKYSDTLPAIMETLPHTDSTSARTRAVRGSGVHTINHSFHIIPKSHRSYGLSHLLERVLDNRHIDIREIYLHNRSKNS